jgi:hypothetical protein
MVSCCCGLCRDEMSRYKELDPANRLLILKALCELRAEVICLAFLIKDFFSNVGSCYLYFFDWMIF